MRDVGAPPVVIGPLYAAKTIDLCADGDTICNGAPPGGPSVAHALYGVNGMVNQAGAVAQCGEPAGRPRGRDACGAQQVPHPLVGTPAERFVESLE